MLVIVLTLVVGAAAAAIIVSQTAWFKNWLRGYIVAESARYLNGRLSIERLGGNLFFGVEMENVGISMDGTEVVAIEDLGLDYNVFQMIAARRVDRRHPSEPARAVPEAGRRDVVDRPVDQEAGAGGGSRGTGVSDCHRQHCRHRCLGRARGAGRDERRRRARSLRSHRRQPVVPLRAGALLRRDLAGYLPRLRAGDWAERALRSCFGPRRHGVHREPRASDRGIRASCRGLDRALPRQAGVQGRGVVREGVAAGDCASGARVVGGAAAAGVRAQGPRPDGSARRRDERPVVCGEGHRSTHG